MNDYTERTWTMVTIRAEIKELMKTYVQYAPRKLQSLSCTDPLTISYQIIKRVKALGMSSRKTA